jgi:hypothetical protein
LSSLTRSSGSGSGRWFFMRLIVLSLDGTDTVLEGSLHPINQGSH